MLLQQPVVIRRDDERNAGGMTNRFVRVEFRTFGLSDRRPRLGRCFPALVQQLEFSFVHGILFLLLFGFFRVGNSSGLGMLAAVGNDAGFEMPDGFLLEC